MSESFVKIDLHDLHQEEAIIDNAIHYIEELFRLNAGGHDAGHTMRVYRNVIP